MTSLLAGRKVAGRRPVAVGGRQVPDWHQSGACGRVYDGDGTRRDAAGGQARGHLSRLGHHPVAAVAAGQPR